MERLIITMYRVSRSVSKQDVRSAEWFQAVFVTTLTTKSHFA